ncbi:TorF family putative porin [Hyphomonas sp.]|uniref:TorF family putative porin n=1 Tax=Hyphomonas sp. TaxID=87 RepID=UPI0030FAB215
MKIKVSRAGVALVALLATAGTAVAEGEWSGNVAVTSDYVWRGVSQSNEDPAISGGFDYSNGIFYAGTWASNVDFGDASDTNLEADFYGGVASEFANGVTWDLGVIYYAYPDADDEDLDFVELQAALGYEFEGGVGVGGAVFWDPDNESVYIQGTAGYSFTEAFAADVSVGNYSFDGGGDYTNWSIGGTYALPIGIDVDLRYWGTDVDNVDIADERVVLTLSKSL